MADEYGYELRDDNDKVIEVIYGQGRKGDPGPEGPQGPRGEKGDPGQDGAPGANGKNVEFRFAVNSDNEQVIQWSVAGLNEWQDLIRYADLRGEQGSPGLPGAPGADGRDGINGQDGSTFVLKGAVAYEADLPNPDAYSSGDAFIIRLNTADDTPLGAVAVIVNGAWEIVGNVGLAAADLALKADLSYVDATFVKKGDYDASNWDVLYERALTTAIISDGQPGDKAWAFTETIGGGPFQGAQVQQPVVFGTYGQAIRVTGQQTVAERDRNQWSATRLFQARFRFERVAAPTDPSNDAVSLRVEFLDSEMNPLGYETLELLDPVPPGFYERDILLSEASFDGAIQVTPPAGTAYAIAYLETFGLDSVDDIYFVELRDISWYQDGSKLLFPSDFRFDQRLIPELPHDVANTFYVTADGDDANGGQSLTDPLATVPEALSRMAANGSPCVTIVHPGTYLVPPNTEIPAGCALYGYDLRVTNLALANSAGNALAVGAEREENMFLMTNGIKVRGFTFKNLAHEAAPADWYTNNAYWTRNVGRPNEVVIPADQRHPYPPKKGYVFAFKPGEFITRSPYIADCSSLHEFDHESTMYLPIDRENDNPGFPMGQGNAIVDGAILDPYSPVRSIVVDSYTAINPNGVGYLILNNGFVQLVSVFTNWSKVGVWCHNGGHVTIANSNTTFGDYAFAATGYRNIVSMPVLDTEDSWTPNATDAFAIQAIKPTLQQGMTSAALSAGMPNTANLINATERDAGLLVDAIVGDLRRGQDNGTRQFFQRLFDWDGNLYFDASLIPYFVASWDYAETQMKAVSSVAGNNVLTVIFDALREYLQESFPAESILSFFSSLVEATGQQLSYAGTGVNYNSLPDAQGGTGRTPVPSSVFIRTSGGRIFATYSTETGDTYLGDDLRVDYERSTIEGQAFARGVQNITLPLIIGLSG